MQRSNQQYSNSLLNDELGTFQISHFQEANIGNRQVIE